MNRQALKDYPIGYPNKDGRLYDPVTAAVIVGTVATGYSMREQQMASKKAGEQQAMAQEQARQQDLEARRIAASAKPQEEQATLLTKAAQGNVLGNLGLMVEPTKKKDVATLGGTSSGTGLGFGV